MPRTSIIASTKRYSKDLRDKKIPRETDNKASFLAGNITETLTFSIEQMAELGEDFLFQRDIRLEALGIHQLAYQLPLLL